ncbi:hypothetical protein EKO27_g10771 [Xylaria grammica]|uniref:Peptidase S8/S53 domain-containing protein n=1 Tax=Xylaria grammica TaxID=363999 RepID=A0A439CQB4_9PEZI|nr:hypothetical protein EKO27_g10771 [Xylaria grammica]
MGFDMRHLMALQADPDEDQEYGYTAEEDEQSAQAPASSSSPVVNTARSPFGVENDIRDGRYKLTSKITGDVDTQWKNEKGWEQLNDYQVYLETVEKLVEQEKSYIHLFSQSQTNLLQHVLEKAENFYPDRLHKAKFLIQLIANLDPTQLFPKRGLKPLHAAAEFDIKQLNEGHTSDTGLTIYICNLMGSRAATEICETNQNKENILHLAVSHDFKDVQILIEMADKMAFKQKRVQQQRRENTFLEDDGNTPLHDALDFENHFKKPGPVCAISLPMGSAAGTHGVELPRRPSMMPRVDATAPTTQQQANRAKVRAALPNTLHAAQARRSGPGMCSTCDNARKNNHYAMKRRIDIITKLIERDPDTLTIHNSAGLSPYLYLMVGSQRSQKDATSEPNASLTNAQEQPLVPELRRQMTGDANHFGDAGKGEQRDSATSRTEEKLRSEKDMEKNSQRVSSLRKEAAGTAVSKGGDTRIGSGVKEPVRSIRVTHKDEELKPTDIGSEKALVGLKETLFYLGTYEKRKFSLVGHQRVRFETKENFDFLVFEPMMASVVLSLEYTEEDLKDMPRDEEEKLSLWRRDEENLKDVFEWLKVDKGVEAIVSLTVKDNPNHYCSDATVLKCLENLEVRYLDWNRPNLCANSSTLPNTIIEISLYWARLNAVLWSWSGAEGLRTLEKLRKVNLYIQRGADVEEEQDESVKAFKLRVENWPGPNKPQIEFRTDNKQFGGDGSGGGPTTNLSLKKHEWIEIASKFAEKLYSSHFEKASRDKPRQYVKIALLDDGVDPTYNHNGTNLHYAGWPTVELGGQEEDPRSFYNSTNQHGSKMAWLIRKVCPFVTIYVAKLDVKGHSDLNSRSFSLRQATEAIKWATECGVDIISMSWNVREVRTQNSNMNDMRQLEIAIDKAADAKILMFGAASDVKESASSEKWMPCDHTKVWSIGATDKQYDAKKYVNKERVDYLFPGEYVLESRRIEDIDVGNSGATALASGLAAMVMSCMRLEDEAIPDNRNVWMGNVMTKVFNSEGNSKSVRVKDVLVMDEAEGVRPLVDKFKAQKV